MSLFSRLFGGGKETPPASGTASGAPPETYKDFEIVAEPQSVGGQYRVSARIEKLVDGVRKSHRMVRADTMGSLEDATAMSLAKAKKVIDEQGEALFR